MNIKLVILTLTLIFQSVISFAGSESPRLNEYFYVNSPEDLKKMSRQEREKYIMFVIRTHQIIQGVFLQNHINVAPKKNETSQFFKFQFTFNKAYASPSTVVSPLLPLVPNQVGRTTSRVVKPILEPVGRKSLPDTFVGNPDVMVNSIPGAIKTHTIRVGNTDIMDLASEESSKLDRAKGAKLSARTQSDSAVTSLEGEYCMFGGHSSRYKKMGSYVICPAPEEMVNHPSCRGLKKKPTFKCQSFGLSSSSDINNSQDLCVSLKNDQGNLDDLTARCAKAFEDFLVKVNGVDPHRFLKIQETVKQGVRVLEKEKGIQQIGLLDFCKQQRQINNKHQAPECVAVLDLMEIVKPTGARTTSTYVSPPLPRSSPGGAR